MGSEQTWSGHLQGGVDVTLRVGEPQALRFRHPQMRPCNAPSFLAECGIHSEHAPRPVGVVKASTTGLVASPDAARAVVLGCAVAVWRVVGIPVAWRQSDLWASTMRPAIRRAGPTTRAAGAAAGIELLRVGRTSLHLVHLYDGRSTHRGVVVQLKLRIGHADLGYLWTHVLTADPLAVADACTDAAVWLWAEALRSDD
jgi:hypothetical protein